MVDTVGAEIKYTAIFMNGPYGSVTGNVKTYREGGQNSLALLNMKYFKWARSSCLSFERSRANKFYRSRTVEGNIW